MIRLFDTGLTDCVFLFYRRCHSSSGELETILRRKLADNMQWHLAGKLCRPLLTTGNVLVVLPDYHLAIPARFALFLIHSLYIAFTRSIGFQQQ